MSFIDELAERGGPLHPTAKSFAQAYSAPASGGIEGVRFLARVVDAHADLEANEAADAAFVEKAGAYLGLLLIGHLSGRHRARAETHRVAIGRFGFFDPFGAIEAALDAEDPREVLAAQVEIAEHEARGQGPVSRIVTAFDEALRAECEGLQITEQFELEVELSDGTRVDLARVRRATEGESDQTLLLAVNKLVAMIPQSRLEVGTSFGEARPRLLPRLLGPAFVRELSKRSEGASLHLENVFGEVYMGVVLSYPDRSRYIREDEVERWGVDAERIHREAVNNLAARSKSAFFARIEADEGVFIMARSGDGHDAARILLPGLHDVLSTELPSPMVVSVPHRDTLLACDSADGLMVDALRSRTKAAAQEAPHRITDELFVLSEDGLAPYR